jgi:predicted transposase YbfD/YdcC
MIERHTEFLRSGIQRTERAYGVSSLSAAEADAARLLQLNRGHWEIENRLHYVRDVSFDEDRCRVRAGTGARVMASIRNLVISIFRLLGFSYVPEGLRYFAMRIERVFELLGI